MGVAALEDLMVRALVISVLLSALPLAALFVVGLIASVLQAATQVQEQALSFVPKLVVVALALVFLGPLGLNRLSGYIAGSLERLPEIARLP